MRWRAAAITAGLALFTAGAPVGGGDVDMYDFGRFQACVTGPAIPSGLASLLAGCTLPRDASGRISADFDGDADVDQDDFGVLQRLLVAR